MKYKCPKCGFIGINRQFTFNRFEAEKYCPNCYYQIDVEKDKIEGDWE